MFLKGKRGAEKVLSIYWFIILVITVVGIYGMVTAYYNHPYDIRELEANILINKAADCLAYGGKMNEGIMNESTLKIFEDFNQDFLAKCNITFNVEQEYSWDEMGQYYIEINFYDVNLKNLGNITKGNNVFKGQCAALKTEKDYALLPKCADNRFLTILGGKQQILIDIFTGVRKSEKNA